MTPPFLSSARILRNDRIVLPSSGHSTTRFLT
jgi:hypothetical protein